MKFVKSNMAKKLIIVLITLMLFNVMYPTITFAVDIGGILLSPIYALLAGVCIIVDGLIGGVIMLKGNIQNGASNMADSVLENPDNVDAAEASNWYIGPDTIFLGGIDILNANIFKNTTSRGVLSNVVKVVARFYIILRNIAALVMLIALIFLGIKILINSNSPSKKSLYLNAIEDWVMGMVLLIFSHIIMIVIMEIAESLTKTIGAAMSSSGSLKWELIKNMALSFDSSTQLISLILYVYLIWLTIVFAIAYFKRFFWTCILVVFAPVFAVMHAFGQQTKQIYSSWMKEFIMNAMVQPFHIIVYTVLIGIPMDMAEGRGWNWAGQSNANFTYALIAMSFIRPAEKYLRRLFGLDKGIANMASHDSGMQTINAVKDAIVGAVESAVAIAGVVATGGAAIGLMGAGGAAAGGAATGGAVAGGTPPVVPPGGTSPGTPSGGPIVPEGAPKPSVDERCTKTISR